VEDYQEMKRKRRETVQSIVKEVGKIIGWQEPGVDEDCAHEYGRLTNDGMMLAFHIDWHDKKLRIDGCFPQGYRPDRQKHSIKVSMDREPTAIAKELQRRLLPGYLPAAAEVVAREKRDREIERCEAVLAKDLAAMLGTVPSQYDSTKFVAYGSAGPYCTAHIGLEESTSIQVEHLTADQARLLCALIAGWLVPTGGN
jgi:hypothetical protein